MLKHFKCSNCGAPLADLQITHPDDSIVWNIYATCDHCGDRSYEQEMKGLFSFVNNEDTQAYSVIEDINMDTSPVVLKTVKVKDYVA
jgi:DNA-directed RNA polymerase subunit RPC12/RpoP